MMRQAEPLSHLPLNVARLRRRIALSTALPAALPYFRFFLVAMMNYLCWRLFSDEPRRGNAVDRQRSSRLLIYSNGWTSQLDPGATHLRSHAIELRHRAVICARKE
jgi:hypothetical protein